MAGNFRLLVSTLLRQASQNTNATTWLQTLANGTWTNVSSSSGAQIVSVSVNGKSTTLALPPGGYCSADIMAACEYALQLKEAGLTRPTSRASAVFQ